MVDDDEQVLFDRDGVKVTQYRFVVESTVYLFQNITSVRHDIKEPPAPPPAPPGDTDFVDILPHFVGCGLVLSLVLFLFWDLPIVLPILVLVYVFIGLLYGLAHIPVSRSRLAETRRASPEEPQAIHTVIVTSSAQEHPALSSTDAAFISDVLAALSKAMALER